MKRLMILGLFVMGLSVNVYAEKTKTIFESFSGMGVNLNKKITKESTLLLLEPIDKVTNNKILRTILSEYDIKTDNFSCLHDGNFICIERDKDKVVKRMIVVVTYMNTRNILNDANNIGLKLHKKYKTSFKCKRTEKKEFMKKMKNRTDFGVVIENTCVSTGISPKIQVSIDRDSYGGDIVAFYNIEKK